MVAQVLEAMLMVSAQVQGAMAMTMLTSVRAQARQQETRLPEFWNLFPSLCALLVDAIMVLMGLCPVKMLCYLFFMNDMLFWY